MKTRNETGRDKVLEARSGNDFIQRYMRERCRAVYYILNTKWNKLPRRAPRCLSISWPGRECLVLVRSANKMKRELFGTGAGRNGSFHYTDSGDCSATAKKAASHRETGWETKGEKGGSRLCVSNVWPRKQILSARCRVLVSWGLSLDERWLLRDLWIGQSDFVQSSTIYVQKSSDQRLSPRANISASRARSLQVRLVAVTLIFKPIEPDLDGASRVNRQQWHAGGTGWRTTNHRSMDSSFGSVDKIGARLWNRTLRSKQFVRRTRWFSFFTLSIFSFLSLSFFRYSSSDPFSSTLLLFACPLDSTRLDFTLYSPFANFLKDFCCQESEREREGGGEERNGRIKGRDGYEGWGSWRVKNKQVHRKEEGRGRN